MKKLTKKERDELRVINNQIDLGANISKEQFDRLIELVQKARSS